LAVVLRNAWTEPTLETIEPLPQLVDPLEPAEEPVPAGVRS
jgi:hypothetical protein